MITAERSSQPDYDAALKWLARQNDDVAYEQRNFLLKDTLALSLRLFKERYCEGKTLADIARDHTFLTHRALRKRIQRVADALMWLVDGQVLPVFVPPHTWATGPRADLLIERIVDAKRKGRTKRSVAASVALDEKRNPADNDVPIYALVGEEEARLDRRIRWRIGKRSRVGVMRSVRRKRNLSQDLLMFGWFGQQTRGLMRAMQMDRVKLAWLRRKSVFRSPAYVQACLDEPRVAPWAAIAMVRNYGLQALPREWYVKLFSPARRQAELDRLFGQETIRKKEPRSYARSLWQAMGGSRGVGAALPAKMRNKETIRAFFRALRQTLETAPFENGHVPALWCSPLRKWAMSLDNSPVKARVKKPMTKEKKTELRLRRVAKQTAKRHGVKLRVPSPPQPLGEDKPSDLESFVMTMGPSLEEQRRAERKAERRADRMMARATGGYAREDERAFLRSLTM